MHEYTLINKGQGITWGGKIRGRKFLGTKFPGFFITPVRELL